MQRGVIASRGAHDAPVHRRWNDCDKKVVRRLDGERATNIPASRGRLSWRGFTRRWIASHRRRA